MLTPLVSVLGLGMKDAVGTIHPSPWLLTSMCELGNSLSVGGSPYMVENSVWVSEHRRARLLKKLQKSSCGLGVGTTQDHGYTGEVYEART